MFALFITLLRPNTSRMLNISEAACNWLEALLEGLALVAHKQKSLESNRVRATRGAGCAGLPPVARLGFGPPGARRRTARPRAVPAWARLRGSMGTC
jgi:hypothetical protein